jgi:ectoine hydroxylase-related dioxygenase (phytanoyl-CoA dioxygenase family)
LLREPVAAGVDRLAVDTDPATVVAALRRDGGVVVTGLLDPATTAVLAGELDPHVQRRAPGFGAEDTSGFYGRNTIRIQGLAVKSPTFVERVLLHPLLLGVADAVLLPQCGDYWMSQAETIYIGPGSAAQQLHRDDLNWSLAARLRVDLQVSTLVALGDYDAEVGATMVVPGSHTGDPDRAVDAAAARPVELAPGDALVYLGSLVHGGGANRTADRWRRALYLGYLVGWLTPEEAVARSITADVAASLPPRALDLLGWSAIRGNTAHDGAEAALKLWQLDADDQVRTGGFFRPR